MLVHGSGVVPPALISLLDVLARIGAQETWSPNAWNHPPAAIMNGGMGAVKQCFEAVFKGSTLRVKRPLKVVIVGKETVGKTR